jgi:hypothetical protein
MPATFKNEKYAGMNFVYTFHNKNCKISAAMKYQQ